jgi:hypothetical protein
MYFIYHIYFEEFLRIPTNDHFRTLRLSLQIYYHWRRGHRKILHFTQISRKNLYVVVIHQPTVTTISLIDVSVDTCIRFQSSRIQHIQLVLNLVLVFWNLETEV